MRAATWWALFHAARPSRAKSACPRCRCDVVKGVHYLGPGGPGEPYRIQSKACPVDVMAEPEMREAVEQHVLAERVGLPRFTGSLGEQDARSVTLAGLVASEVEWVHAALARVGQQKRG